MAQYLHTMVRITDFGRSRAFYEALGFRFSRELDIVRNGELEATNYFFSIGDLEDVVELTFNHDVARTTSAPATATSRSTSATWTPPSSGSPNRASSPSVRHTRSARAVRASASSAIPTATGSS